MSNTITDKTILDMVEEGKNNFISSRFDDAAKLFNSTVRNLERHELDIDAIYFSYARVVSLHKAEKSEQEIQALLDLSISCKNLALKQALNNQKSENNPMQKSVFMYYAQKIMKLMGKDEQRESVVLSLVKLYKTLIDDKNTTTNVQELFQERIIEFCTEYDHPSLKEEYEMIKFAQLLAKAADNLAASEKYHVDVIAANNYIRSASIYVQYNMKKEMEKMLSKALRCSKHGQFEKFGFTMIERPEREKDKTGKEVDPDPDMSDKMIKKYLKILLQTIDQSDDQSNDKSGDNDVNHR